MLKISKQAVSLLLALMLAVLLTGSAGAEGIVREPVTVDLTGTDEVMVYRDIILCLTDVAGNPLSLDLDTMDFNGDGTADVSLTENESDNFLLKRLAGADLLTQDYTYAIPSDVYSSVTFKVCKPKPATIPVTGVTLKLKNKTIKAGKKFTLTATVQPADASNRAVTWTSSNPNVATVSDKGVVTGVKYGVAKIKVTTEDGGFFCTCKVSVARQGTKLTAAEKTFKVSMKTKNYTVTLKDEKGKAIAKAKLYLKVNNKTFTATTNSKGQATFKISNLTKKGTYTAKISFKITDKYDACKKSVKLTVR